jgi:pimeloyl-ACP methyl ester carboxylesterase
VADNLAVLDGLDVDTAVVVGHDWGAPIAWHTVLLRPDRFPALGLLSVPYSPPGITRPTDAFRAMGGDEEFYISYFQKPGRAEAEIEPDVRSWLAGFYFTASGDAPRPTQGTMATVAPGGQLRDRLAVPERLPPWLTEADLDYYTAEFERSGLTGGLNRYRNVDRDWEDFGAFTFAPITVPALFIGGQYDGPTLWGARAIARFDQTLPNLWGSFILGGSGHWVQQERAEQVTRHLIDFLAASTK